MANFYSIQFKQPNTELKWLTHIVLESCGRADIWHQKPALNSTNLSEKICLE